MAIITKYSGARGPCQWDTIKNDWVREADGSLVVVDPKTGQPLVAYERCRACGGKGKIPRPTNTEN